MYLEATWPFMTPAILERGGVWVSGGFCAGERFDTELGDVFKDFGLLSYVERLRMPW